MSAGAPVREELRGRGLALRELDLGLVVAPGGSGKTVLLESWRQALAEAGCDVAWLSLSPLHADPAIFLEDWVEALRDFAPGEADAPFGSDLLGSLPHLGQPDAHRLARHVRRACAELDAPVTLMLDNFHLLGPASPTAEMLDVLLREPGAKPLRFVVASRGARPHAAARLLADGRALEVDADELSLRSDQVERILAEHGLEARSDLALALLAETRGWATGVQLAARALARMPEARRPDFVRSLGKAPDVFDYVAGEVTAGEPEALVAVLEVAAVLGDATEETLVAALADPRLVVCIDEALRKGLLTRTGERLATHPLWEAYLRRRLRQRLDEEAWRELHARLAGLLEETDPERALGICGEGGQTEGIARLLERHGRAWLDLGRHGLVETWMAQVPEERRSASTALARVQAFALGRRDPVAALEQLDAVARRFRAEGDAQREAETLHDILILAGNEYRVDDAVRALRQLVSLRRLVTRPEVRAISLFALGALLARSGRMRAARTLLHRIDTRLLATNERAGVAVSLVVIARWRSWDDALEVMQDLARDPALRRHHSHFLLHAQRALIEGMRGADIEASLREVELCWDTLRDLRLRVSETLAAEAAGLLRSRLGRHEEAIASFERAAELASATRQWDEEGALRGLIAREHLLKGEPADALTHARRSAAIFDAHARGFAIAFHRAGLTARMLAEAGAPDEAQAFAERHARRLRVRELPMAQHAIEIQLARVASLAGDEKTAGRRLEAARAVGSGLRDASPDLDPELLAWASARDAAGAEAPARFEVGSLGGLRVSRGEIAVAERAWRGANTRRLLLRLLAARGRPVRREALEAELWPDLPARRARNNLRVTLSRLRSALEACGGPPALHAEGDRLALDDALAAGWDVARLEALLDGAGDGEEGLATRRDALALYAGPFAPELYDDWAEELRRELEARFRREGTALAEALLEAGRAGDAAAITDRLVHELPAEESAWELAVRASLEAGDASGALLRVERARAALARELDAEPGAALCALEARAREASGGG